MPHRIRAILVDDEGPARGRLRALLAEHPDIHVVSDATDIASAAAATQQHDPDLLFLDIQLRRENGFDLIPLLKRRPHLIFVTAHARFGAQAFDVQATDYLVKPVHPTRLAVALDRIRAQIPTAPLTDEGRVMLQENKRMISVAWARISHIESAQNYSTVHVTGNPPLLIRRSLSEWGQLLPKAEFHRISRSLIVRIGAITQFRRISRDVHHVSLGGNPSPIVLSRRAGSILARIVRDAPPSNTSSPTPLSQAPVP